MVCALDIASGGAGIWTNGDGNVRDTRVSLKFDKCGIDFGFLVTEVPGGEVRITRKRGSCFH